MARTTLTTRRKTNEHRATARKPSRATQRPAPRTGGGNKGLQEFLDRFTTALTAGDGEGAAACFEYPAFMAMSGASGGNQVLQEPGTVAAFFGQAPQQYHAKGVEQTFADIEQVDWLSDDFVLVRARFPYIDRHGNDMGDSESSVYVLRKSDPDYAICAAFTLGVEGERPHSRKRA